MLRLHSKTAELGIYVGKGAHLKAILPLRNRGIARPVVTRQGLATTGYFADGFDANLKAATVFDHH